MPTPPKMRQDGVGLYIHFPFCRAKCPYCHFDSVPYSDAGADLWLERLELEVRLFAHRGMAVETIYLGGGTPSLLRPGRLDCLVRILADGFRLECREFTLEANPGTVDPGAIRSWRGAGVSRVSVGVQSFDDRVLRILGRGYSGREAQVFCQACRDAGFASLGLDLMTGVPGEPEEAAVKTLETALGLAPDHVSLYILEEVEGLPMAAVLEKTPVDEDAVAAAHATISSGLEAAGLRRYEISNFARPGRECLHNLKYWRYEPFLGLGPSACSHLQSRRWCNVRGIDRWADALIRGADTREEDVVLSAAEEAREALIFGLRLVEGVDLEGLRARFGVDLANLFRAEIAALRHDGLLVRHGSGLRIPVDKLLISNLVFSKFV